MNGDKQETAHRSLPHAGKLSACAYIRSTGSAIDRRMSGATDMTRAGEKKTCDLASL